MYSLHINAFGNRIICKGHTERRSYRLVFTGTYQECQNTSIGFAMMHAINGLPLGTTK